VVLDNTYSTVDSRRSLVALGKKLGAPVRAVWLETSIEEAQVNAVTRLVRKYGKLPPPEELKALSKKDPNAFGPFVLFRYRKQFEPPTAAEGLTVERVPFAREAQGPDYRHKALLLDHDGTLRRTRSGKKYPSDPEDVTVLPGRRETLERYLREGYLLFGVSNQGDVARGVLTAEDARRCFERTHQLLGLSFETAFCPHEPAPITCWCRKPMPGLGVAFLERFKLDRAQTLMVGDRGTDETFAQRCGVGFRHADAFFSA
jgi:histidinol-phosphate phosphatase family protein